MSYIFTGRLRANTCGGSVAPLADATLLVYRALDGEEPGFLVRDHEDIRGREYRLLAQGRTDPAGEFRIDFGEKTIFGHRGSTHVYSGEPMAVDAYVRTSDSAPTDHDPEPVQFSLGTITPEWQAQGQDQVARYEHDIPESEWNQVRLALDTWTVHGRVLRADNRQPVAGLKVLAYDADLLQDDFLGSGTTDSDGRFRIDFSGETFRQTGVPGAQFERGGPEVYFRIETAEGAVVYEEGKARGNRPDRANVSNCFEAELMIDLQAAPTV